MNIDSSELNRIKLKNRLQTAGLLAVMGLFAWLLGKWLLGDAFGVFTVVALIFFMLFNPALSPNLILKAYRATPISQAQSPELYQITQLLSQRAGLSYQPRLFYLPIGTMNAFTTGKDENAIIALSDGLLRRLDIEEITGVLAHEIGHIKHHDATIMTLSDLMGQLTRLFSLAGQFMVLFSIPMMIAGTVSLHWPAFLLIVFAPILSALLQLAISRSREFQADITAAQLLGTPDPLIRALLKLEQQGSYWERFYRASSDNAFLKTHPSTHDRVQQLKSVQLSSPWDAILTRSSWQHPWYHQPSIRPRKVSRFFWF